MRKHGLDKKKVTALIVTILASSPMVMSATDNPAHPNLNDFEISTLFDNSQSQDSPSLLNSFRQSELNESKKEFQNILNLINQKKLEEAKEQVSTALKENQNQAMFYILQGFIETQQENTIAAQQSFQKALTINPKNQLAYLSLAQTYLVTGNLNKAKDLINQALQINDGISYAYLLLANISYKQKQYADAEEKLLLALQKVKGDFNNELAIFKNLGKFYAAQKQPAKLLTQLEDLTKRYPNNSQALSALAGAQIVNNQKASAESTLRRLIKQDKTDINNRLFLAKLLITEPNNEKEVLGLLDETAAIDPTNPQALIFKVAYLNKLQRYREALEVADNIDKLFSKQAIGKILKGEVYLATKELSKALDSYQTAYQKQPSDKVLLVIADILNSQNKSQQAIALLSNALEKDPKNESIHLKIASIYQQHNDIKQAENHYRSILNIHSENLVALNNLALLYAQQNNPMAIELAEKAYSKAPQSAFIADTYGYILLKQGQSKQSLNILEKAANLAPSSNDIQFHLAQAFAANNIDSRAIEILDNITKDKKDFTARKAAIDLLKKLNAE